MRYLLIILFALLPLMASAVEFDEDTRSLPLGRAAQVFEDVSGEATVSDVSAMPERFRPAGSDTFSAGHSDSAFWLKVDLLYLPKDVAAHREWLVELAYPPMDYVDFYLPDASGTPHLAWQTGDMLPFSSRQIKQNNYLFEVGFEPGQSKTVYLRVKSSSSIQVPLSLWSGRAYLEEQPAQVYVLGALYGVLLVMLVYNLCIYIAVRDKNYLYYVLYVAPFGVYQLALNGIGVEYLWPQSPWLANAAPVFLLMMSILFACQFSRSFLQTRAIAAWLDKALLLVMTGAGVLMLMSLSPALGLALRSFGALVLLFTLMIFGAGIAAILHNTREARYFVLAWSAFLIGSVLHVGMLMGYLPHNFLTMYGNQIGSALEAALLSMALATRFNQSREEHAQVMLQARDNLERANQELAASNRLKDQFLATLTHELRTPMNGVIGSLELMNTVELGTELASYHQTAVSSAQDMMGMVNGILTLTELQAGRVHAKAEAFDLRSLIQGLKGQFYAAAQEKGNEFIIDWVEPVRTNLLGDACKLRRCLECLLDNAIKFTASGSVKIRIREQGRLDEPPHLLIEVVDDGIGFSRLDEATLYQHFFQVDGSLTRQYGGLGIGLAICKRLVELQGGRLSHISEPGKGSSFAISLSFGPVVEAVAQQESPLELRSSDGPG
jgi:signal transduction histidine kinase